MGNTDAWSMQRAVDYAGDLLTGTRIHLRGVVDRDMPTLAAWARDPQQTILADTHVAPGSEAATRAKLAQWATNEEGSAFFVIESREGAKAPAVLLGHVTLFAVQPRTRAATFAISIGPEHVGQGFGLEATRLMLRYGFREMNLHRIQLQVLDYNKRAIAMYGKAGFSEEGRRREAVYHGGRYHDEVLMAVLESDPPPPNLA